MDRIGWASIGGESRGRASRHRTVVIGIVSRSGDDLRGVARPDGRAVPVRRGIAIDWVMPRQESDRIGGCRRCPARSRGWTRTWKSRGTGADFHAAFIATLPQGAQRPPARSLCREDRRAVPRGRESREIPGKARYPDVAVVRTGPGAGPPMTGAGASPRSDLATGHRSLDEDRARKASARPGSRSAASPIGIWSRRSSCSRRRTRRNPASRTYLAKRADVIEQPVHWSSWTSSSEAVACRWTIRCRRAIITPSSPAPTERPASEVVRLVAPASLCRSSRSPSTQPRPRCPPRTWPRSSPRPSERGRYERSIDYGEPLNLPLAPEDRAWAEETARTPLA